MTSNRSRLPLFERFVRSPSHRQIITNTTWLVLDKVVYAAIGLAVGVWVARYLQPASFGVLSYALAIVGFVTPIAGLGLERIIVRDVVREPTGKDEILGTAMALRLGTSLVLVVVLVGAAASGIGPQDRILRWLIAITACQLIFAAVGDTVSSWFSSQLQSGYVVLARNSSAVLAGLFRVFLILASAHLIAFGFATVLQVLVYSIVVVALYRYAGNRLSALTVRRRLARQMLSDSWPLILSGLAIAIYMRIDQIMLGSLASVEELGVYSVAVRLSELWYFVPSAVALSLFPAIIRSRENDAPDIYRMRMQAFFDMMTGMAYMIAIPLLLIATPLVVMLFGPEYAKAGAVLQIHIWALVFVSLGAARGRWLIVENLTGFLLFATLLGVVVNIPLNFLLIPRYGGVGAAWATLISQAASTFFANFFHRSLKPVIRFSLLGLLVPIRPHLLLRLLRDIGPGRI